jgi:1,4-dihydroxy-2-naphthoyl-CoA hydrolase
MATTRAIPDTIHPSTDRGRRRKGALRHPVTGRASSGLHGRPARADARRPPRGELPRLPREQWAPALAKDLRGGLSDLLGIEILELAPGRVETRMELNEALMISAGDVLHGGTVVAFADSTAGWGALFSLPDGIDGLTTAEMSINLVGTTRVPDALRCSATLVHGGRSTQVWDATVTRERDGRPVAHYRATQFLVPAA